MSVNYLVRERFSSSKASQSCDVAGAVKQQLQHHISQLFARQLCVTDGIRPVHSISMCMTLDGEAVEYKAGREGLIPLDVQASLTKLAGATQVELDLSYAFIWNFGDNLLEEGPFAITDYLDDCPEEVFSCLSYVLHNDADSSTDTTAGIITMYGKQNGQLHRGIVELQEIEELPAFGKWHAEKTALMIEDAAIKEGKETKVREVCKELMAMSDMDDHDISDGLLLLNLNQFHAKSIDELKSFIALSQELLQLIHPDHEDYLSDWFMQAGLLDHSESGPSLLNIDLGLDGRLVLSLADARLERLDD